MEFTGTKYRQLSKQQASDLTMLLGLIHASIGQKPEMAQLKKDAIEQKMFITSIIIKRIEGMKLPELQPSAILMIDLLADGNPGQAILILVEVLEKMDEYKPDKIDATFIGMHVFPAGRFTKEYADYLYDLKRNDHGKKFK